MSHCKFFATVAFVLCTSPCFAGELKASDIEIVSVIPRSPDVKPYVMAIRDDGVRLPKPARTEPEANVAKNDSLASAPYEHVIAGEPLGLPMPQPDKENRASSN